MAPLYILLKTLSYAWSGCGNFILFLNVQYGQNNCGLSIDSLVLKSLVLLKDRRKNDFNRERLASIYSKMREYSCDELEMWKGDMVMQK